MVTDWRYRLEHVGDMFVDALGVTITAARRCAAGVALGYHLNELNKKKTKVATGIGNRVIEIRKDNPGFLSYDDQISRFYAELDGIEETITDCMHTRNTLKQRLLQTFRCCAPCSTTDSAEPYRSTVLG